MKLTFRNIGYFPYIAYKKARQLPRVVSDLEPKFLSDETFSPAIGSVYAIVVCYSAFGVTEDFIDLLRSLRKANVNAIVVCNGHPQPAALERLRKEAHRILVRRNIGRDLGAYRAATLYLNAQALPASRVLYFNDSLIYLAGEGLDRMIQRLAEGKYPVIGTFENHEYEHHIGSYAFSVSGEVFKNPKMLAFWRRYRPYDIRPHAINKGEIGMSQRFKKLGYDIDVIYSLDRLGEKLHEMDAAQILELVRYMPTAWRSVFFDRTRKGPLGPEISLVDEFCDTPPAPPPRPAGPVLLSASGGARTRPRAEPHAIAPASEPLLSTRMNLAKMALIDLILGEISIRSQVHMGFGVFHVLMKAPLVKKDLMQRGIYVEHDCNLILSNVPEGMRAAVLRQLINRGRPIYFRGMKLFRVHHGFE